MKSYLYVRCSLSEHSGQDFANYETFLFFVEEAKHWGSFYKDVENSALQHGVGF